MNEIMDNITIDRYEVRNGYADITINLENNGSSIYYYVYDDGNQSYSVGVQPDEDAEDRDEAHYPDVVITPSTNHKLSEAELKQLSKLLKCDEKTTIKLFKIIETTIKLIKIHCYIYEFVGFW